MYVHFVYVLKIHAADKFIFLRFVRKIIWFLFQVVFHDLPGSAITPHFLYLDFKKNHEMCHVLITISLPFSLCSPVHTLILR